LSNGVGVDRRRLGDRVQPDQFVQSAADDYDYDFDYDYYDD
jgi:hypothetical protein